MQSSVSEFTACEIQITGFTMLGLYRSDERVQVYHARELALDRSVRITLLKPEFVKNLAVRTDFIRQAKSTSKVDHPGVIPVYQIGQASNGCPYFVSPSVEATPWSQLIRRFSLQENIEILMKVADVIGQAHRRRLLHRDIRPENVLITEGNAVYVTGWGTSISVDMDATAEKFDLGGSPPYMSPEMATGPQSMLGPRSDVYLLGATLFEILGGRPPHRGHTQMQILAAASRNEMRSISPTLLQKRDPSGQLLAIAMKAMSQFMLDRHQSAEGFKQALANYLGHSDSLRLTQRALRSQFTADRSLLSADYRVAMLDFEEALSIWPENRVAQEGLVKVRNEFERLVRERSKLRKSCAVILAGIFLCEIMLSWAIPHMVSL